MNEVAPIHAAMGFARSEDIIPDSEIPGLLRCKTYPVDADRHKAFEMHEVSALDWSLPGAQTLALEEMGFENIELSHVDGLAPVLEEIRQNSEISAEQATQLRKKLTFSAFPLANGKKLRLLFIAPEGLIMRKSGPNGLKPDPAEALTGMNGHDGALQAHGDQDVNGTPVKQILRGFAPWLFRHQSPNRRNQLSPFFLINLWIPLQQITRPLALMDRRTLDAKTQQLRYALPIDGFLDRDIDQALNDIWVFRYDERQQWYFSSDMDARQAYVFDTLGTPHGAIFLPGETTAEQYYCALQRAKQAVDRNEPEALQALSSFAPQPCQKDTPKALRAAIEEFKRLHKEVIHDDIGLLKQNRWPERCEFALDRVIRKSIEMRVVALML